MKTTTKPLKRNHNFYLMTILLLITKTMFAQSGDINKLENFHKEVQDDDYIHVSRQSMETSPAYRIFESEFFTVQVNIDENGDNIVGDASNEPSIAVDPTNPDRIVIGWRHFETIESNFRQAGYGYSTDGGLTWTFPGVIDPGNFRSDPVLDFDSEGNFYYNSLTGNNFATDVSKIDDGGVDWGTPVPAFGGDKQWMRIDRTDGIGSGNNYSFWNRSFSTCSPGQFTRSTDGSESFENCVEISGNPVWGTLAVNAEGVLYLVGQISSGIKVIKSTSAQDPNEQVIWDSTYDVDLDGKLKGFDGNVNPVGLLGQLWIDIDISDGPGHGNIYVLATVERFSVSDPADVMFARSRDGGDTFSEPIRINNDIGTDNTQWFGTMSVAPNGRIDVIWLDTRDAPAGTNMSVLYYSFSDDEGETWSDNEPLSIAFDPNIGYPQQDKMGDYFDMVSHDNGAHLAWANTINGEQDVYYTHIIPSNIVSVEDNISTDNLKFKNYPNPFVDETTIELFVQNKEHVTIEVYDLLGNKLKTLLNENVQGNYSLKWDGSNDRGRRLKTGFYLISIQSESKTSIIKVLLNQ